MKWNNYKKVYVLFGTPYGSKNKIYLNIPLGILQVISNNKKYVEVKYRK
jgi:hypothetical protein